MYEMFDHTADLGLRFTAADLPGLLVEAARGLTAVIVEEPRRLAADESARFEVEGTQPDYLLFDWLNELLYRFAITGWVGREFQVEVSETGLVATASGETVDPQTGRLAHEVKAITYHGLVVERAGEGWMGEVIVDI